MCKDVSSSYFSVRRLSPIVVVSNGLVRHWWIDSCSSEGNVEGVLSLQSLSCGRSCVDHGRQYCHCRFFKSIDQKYPKTLVKNLLTSVAKFLKYKILPILYCLVEFYNSHWYHWFWIQANIENASYGVTLCAERSAVARAVAEGHMQFRAIAVATEQDDPAYPCGICRQFLLEFGDMKVWLRAVFLSFMGSFEWPQQIPLFWRKGKECFCSVSFLSLLCFQTLTLINTYICDLATQL